tara:strand:- start:158 stop:817 length:660 start_codon:yes stop_codon:yes gene_type:complete
LLLEIDPFAVNRFLRKFRKLKGVPKGMTARTFNDKRYFGMVIADEALRGGKALERCIHVRAMHQHFVDGLDWRDTEYSRLYDKKYKKMYKKGDFDDFARKKLERYDSIFVDIKSKGYKQAASIEENIEIALNKRGKILLIDGRHRLILAQLLGLKKIPAVVNLIAKSFARNFSDDSGSLRSQLQIHTLEQRLDSLITVPGGFRKKGVLVNAFQRSYFPK